ncbi:MAG: dimethylamine corrinoid protein 3 [Candidatus Aminicenantes bacterium]|nr:dimethylamine corrinoid protein 3 [Candidatus Aminicenantes bacterium]NIM81138.1 dimethylamine corrinoid protein 3 [Candidatus Aminicenantes bacterium]NIN20512.1 dimethylamine corrinoid protein 3 [Candidatus Aminicenantes bacterium]NIN44285.1 dimethylamine corrinoid protein 3 [Candidatus Aminicenantes bacterium]NIN87104.1 dimethylamine corrinoid protein 3 [Candidatus Aminicenantes bacterium]
MTENEMFEKAQEAIEKGDTETAVQLAKQGLEADIDGIELLNKGFIPGINKVGDLFGDGQLFLPELILSANAMQGVIEIINASLEKKGKKQKRGKVVIGTVEGDLHDIGKTIVVSLLKANGFEVKDLGRDVPVDRFIEEAEAFGANVIGTSALLTTTMTVQKELEEQLKEKGLKGKYKTIVGGAPVTERWAKRIGADAYAADATDGVRKIKELLVNN